jgi:two-component system alkaline phosphatase synthesis response regulator PhoP
MAKTIMVVDDEPRLVTLVEAYLNQEGFRVVTAGDGRQALFLARQEKPDLIVLDIMMPEMDGYEFMRLHRKEQDTPIILLTARVEDDDKVLGLELGADDYLTKPFEMAELLARVEARLRAGAPAPAPRHVYRFGPVQVDFRRAEVTRGGRSVELSAKELQLLRYFVEHRGATLTREELLHTVWGYERTPATRTVDVHVAGLRRKLEADARHPQFFLTLHGLGYRFVG